MANDFSGDANCVALWKFDNDATDSKGNNDLTAAGSPSYDSSVKKEGTHSIDLERDSAQYCDIADASLDAGFPGKGGTGEQSFSICAWFRKESEVPANEFFGIVSKYSTAGDLRTFALRLDENEDVEFSIGYNSGQNFTNLEFGTTPSLNKWYHVGAVFDASDNSMKIRVWDDDGGALLDSNATGSAGGDMSPRTAPLEVGRYGEDSDHCFDGWLDEVVVFKDVLSDAEIDQIRAGTYGAGAAGWSHNFLGVANANIGKINGVAIASIAKVNGVE